MILGYSEGRRLAGGSTDDRQLQAGGSTKVDFEIAVPGDADSTAVQDVQSAVTILSTNSEVVLTTMKAEVDAAPRLQTALAAQGASMILESVTATVAAPSTTVVNA